MKHIFIYTLILVFLFCGCSTQNNITPTIEDTVNVESTTVTELESPTETPIPTGQQMPVFSQQPMVAVSLPLIHNYTNVEDTVVFRYDYQSIHITVQDQEVADRIIIDFLNRQDRDHETASSFSEYAIQRQASIEPATPYFYKALYSPTRLDQSVLSLYSHRIIFTGNRHPEHECTAANYNMTTGEVLTLGSILYDQEADAALCELVISKMDALSDDLHLYDDYEEFVYHRFEQPTQESGRRLQEGLHQSRLVVVTGCFIHRKQLG